MRSKDKWRKKTKHWISTYSPHSFTLMSFQNKLAFCKLTIYPWVLSNGEVWYKLTSTNTFLRRKQNLSRPSPDCYQRQLLNKTWKEKLIYDLLFDDAFRKLSAAISSPICSLTAPFNPNPEVLLRLIFRLKCLLVCFTVKTDVSESPAQEEINQFSRRSQWNIHKYTSQLARIPQYC